MSQLAYNGEQDEDSETMLSFALEAEAEGADDAEGEEWVATHTAAGRESTLLSNLMCYSR